LTARNDEGSPAVPSPIGQWKIAYSPNMPASARCSNSPFIVFGAMKLFISRYGQ
jgi:hypothetical protein